MVHVFVPVASSKAGKKRLLMGLAVVCAALGLLFVGLAIITVRQSARLAEHGVVVEGSVTELENGTRATVAFSTSAGERLTVTIDGRAPLPLPGQKAPIRYDPDDPSTARFDGPYAGSNATWGTWATVSLMFFGLAALSLVLRKYLGRMTAASQDFWARTLPAQQQASTPPAKRSPARENLSALLTVLGGIGLLVGLGVGVSLYRHANVKAKLSTLQVGDVLVYRTTEDGKSWFYGERVSRIEGDQVGLQRTQLRSTSLDHLSTSSARDFASVELSRPLAEIRADQDSHGPSELVIIEIRRD